MDLPFRKMREHRDLSQEDLANFEVVQDIEDGARGVRSEYLERVYQALQETSSEWRTKVGQ